MNNVQGFSESKLELVENVAVQPEAPPEYTAKDEAPQCSSSSGRSSNEEVPKCTAQPPMNITVQVNAAELRRRKTIAEY